MGFVYLRVPVMMYYKPLYLSHIMVLLSSSMTGEFIIGCLGYGFLICLGATVLLFLSFSHYIFFNLLIVE